MRTARLDYRPGNGPTPVSFNRPRTDAPPPAPKAPRKTPVKAAAPTPPAHAPKRMPPATRAQLRRLIETFGARTAAQALGVTTSNLADWWTDRRALPDDMVPVIKTTHDALLKDLES
jgi:pyruvate/2-oxoglutarate dehydrogenase complex dihydrolipoamide acyltransferase (E2) component